MAAPNRRGYGVASLHRSLPPARGPVPSCASGEPAADAASSTSRSRPALHIATDVGELSFLSTATHSGTATELNRSELAIEAFHPADAETTRRMIAALACH